MTTYHPTTATCAKCHVEIVWTRGQWVAAGTSVCSTGATHRPTLASAVAALSA